MAKMSNPQKNLILAAHNRPAKVTPYGSRGEVVISARLFASGEVLLRNGWATRGDHGWLNVTTAGLVAAGVDMGALHTEALESPEHQQHRNVLHEQRASFRQQDHAGCIERHKHESAEMARRYPRKSVEGTRLRPLPADDPHSTVFYAAEPEDRGAYLRPDES